MERVNLICLQCEHYTPLEGGCKAFPFASGGVPEEIIENNRHDKPLPGQTNDLVFRSHKDYTRRIQHTTPVAKHSV